MNSVATTTSLRSTDFDFVSSLIRSQSAIVLNRDKEYLVESRLMPVARAHGFESVTHLICHLRAKPQKHITDKVVDAMTVNETSFFRDLSPFDSLRSNIIPELLKSKGADKTLSIWSNACSSGQEIYSIAMLLLENFPQLKTWKLRLLATDLSDQMLARARRGCFNSTEVSRGLPKELLTKYFKQQGDVWQISETLRVMVEFRKVNLIEPWLPSLQKMDIIFLRNVLIYFDTETKAQVLTKVRGSLSDNGFLFLGNAETILNLKAPFRREIIANSTVYRAAPIVKE